MRQAAATLQAWPVPADLEWFGVTDPALLPVGLADRMLLSIHEAVLGRAVEHTAACTACGTLNTLAIGRADVVEHAPVSAWLAPGRGISEPTYEDLQGARGDRDALVRRCTIGPALGPADLAVGVAALEKIEGSLSGPLHASCIECGAGLVVDSDVVVLVLVALAGACAEFDREVHVLAATYGWDLSTIESLPDRRRQRLCALACEWSA